MKVYLFYIENSGYYLFDFHNLRLITFDNKKDYNSLVDFIDKNKIPLNSVIDLPVQFSSKLPSIQPTTNTSINNTIKKIVINVSNACNLHCTYCYATNGNYGKKISLMSTETAKASFKYYSAKYGNIEKVQFFGGEPMLNLDAIKAVCHEATVAFENNKISLMPKFSIVTNGSLLNEEVVDVVRKYNLRLTVSMDAPAHIHNKVRSSGKKEAKFYNIIERLNVIKNELKSSFSCELTFSHEHFRSKYSLVDLYKETLNLGLFNNLILGYAYFKDGSHKEYTEYFKASYIELIHYYLDNFTKTNPGNLLRIQMIDSVIVKLVNRISKKFICPIIKHSQLIFPDGSLYPCQFFINNNFLLGNVKSGYNDRYNLLLSKYEEFHNKDTNPACKECWNKPFCSQCPGNENIRYNRDPELTIGTIEPRSCELYKKLNPTILAKFVEIFNNPNKRTCFTKNWRKVFNV